MKVLGSSGLHWGDPPTIEWREEGGDLFEYRTEILSVVMCPICGNQVECEAETEGWTEGDWGRWVHEDYGPAMGECCGFLLADWWDGPRAYEFPETTVTR